MQTEDRKTQKFNAQWLINSKAYINPIILCVLTKTILNPFERYKLIRQTQNLFVLYEKDQLLNFGQYLQKIVNKQGFFSLWKSNLTSIYLIFPQLAGQLIFYENIKQALLQDNPDSLFFKGLSASLSAFTCLLFTYPFDTVRVRQATELGTKTERVYKKFNKSFELIRSREGFIKGLYSGLGVAAIHSIALSYLTLGLNQIIPQFNYEYLKDKNTAISFILAFQILYPLDSIRHRLQVKSILFNQEASKTKDIISKLKVQLTDFKFSWLYGGWTVNFVRSALRIGLIHELSQHDLNPSHYF